MGIAIISTYPPRKCGIAEYTHDLRTALLAGGESYVPIFAMEINNSHADGEEVAYQIRKDQILDYIHAAEMINANPHINAVMLQHEFGLFGGLWGDYIIHLLKLINKPVFTTFHTVLETPNNEIVHIVETLAGLSQRVMTFSFKGISTLSSVYKIDPEKLIYFPLGVKDSKERPRHELKKTLNISHEIVASTFGLLSPNKGIELVLHAMQDVVKDHPEFLYMIIGVTHPETFRFFGEKYRQELLMLIYKLGLENNVMFVPHYLSNEALKDYIEVSDIYITPYHTKEQISSATLTLAASMGKAVLSTPYYYAEELLSGDCGILFPFRDTNMLAQKLRELIKNPNLIEALGSAAKNRTKGFAWPKIAHSYIRLMYGSDQ